MLPFTGALTGAVPGLVLEALPVEGTVSGGPSGAVGALALGTPLASGAIASPLVSGACAPSGLVKLLAGTSVTVPFSIAGSVGRITGGGAAAGVAAVLGVSTL